MSNKFGLIGVPSSAGARRRGQDLAPMVIRDAGLLEHVRSAAVELIDLGDLPSTRYRRDSQHPTSQNLSRVCKVVRQVARRVETCIEDGLRPLVLGGDCTVTIGTVAGALKHCPNLGLIYFDGDADMNTPNDTPSGILDGMVMAHLLGDGAKELARIGPRYPLLTPDKVVMFGYNVTSGWIDPSELKRFNACPLMKYSVHDVRLDPEGAARRAMSAIENTCDLFLLHFDVDVIDHVEFPAADVPHEGGLQLHVAREALDVFFTSRKLGGFILTEFNAKHERAGVWALTLIAILTRALRAQRAADEISH